VKFVSLIPVCVNLIQEKGIGLTGMNGVTGVVGKTGTSGDRVLDHVEEEVSARGLERARVLTQIPSQSRVAIFV